MAQRSFRVRWLIALAFVPAAAALSPTEPDKVDPSHIAPIKNTGAFFGNAGCAASGCHNANGPRGTPGSEYSTWANEDPHAKAFGVLLSKEGQQMERLYRRDPNADAGKDQLCLKCHAPLGVDKEHPELRSDAVGCETCHGSSAQWRTTHYQNEWKSLDSGVKQSRGMTETKDLTSRVEKCASCHVGSKGMEVDHDLIAAGHPRLFFEYSAYHDLLPRHWQEPMSDTTFHARAWAIGRVTAARAAVELLHDRAASPDRWPELAEFNCYSCHRQLSGETTPPKDRAPGSLAAGSWHFALLEAIAGLGDGFAPPQPVDLTLFRKKLHELHAKPADIANAAKPLATALGAWQVNLKSAHGIDLDVMRKQLAGQHPTDWEQATQHYLAISAFHRSQPTPDQHRDGLMRLRDMLKFPAADGGKKINSPSRFNVNDYRSEASKLLSTARTSALAPKGRYTIAHGFSPGATRVFALSPEAAAHSAFNGQVPGAPLVTTPGPNDNNAGDCKNCHEHEKSEYKQRGVYHFIKANPSTIWETDDPHARAWENIVPEKNQIARRMASSLGYDVSRKPECLVCHAVDATPTEARMDKKSFAWKYGVGCEACHGDAEKWFEPHRKETWRSVEPGRKEAEFGLVDLRDPAKRAAKCASCHVGNVAEGKFVTHEMYAAGHPPLLPFEPVTFGRDQPAHWRLPKDVKYFESLSSDDAKRLYHAPKDEDYIARSLAVGAVVNLRETARTLAMAAKDWPDGAMLDFAHFDCYACHHELVTPSHRQARGYTGTPGRPTVRLLPTALVAVVLGQTKSDRRIEFRQVLQELHLAYTGRPFGDPKAIATAADRLVKKCQQCLIDLSEVKYNDAGRNQLLAAIQQAVPAEPWDYDTAQQFVWATRALKAYGTTGAEWNPLRRHVLLEAGLGPDRKVESVLKKRQQLRDDFDPKQFANDWKQSTR